LKNITYKCLEVTLPVMDTRGDRVGFKRRAQQVFLGKDHRRRQVAGSRGRQKVIHRRRQEAGSRGRQKVIHRGSKRATVQAGKWLVT
jgi:hypothetical protein